MQASASTIESDTGTRSRWSSPGRSLARSDCSVTICERVIVRHAIRGQQQMRPHDVSHQWSTCDSDGITLAHKAGLGTAAPCRHHAGVASRNLVFGEDPEHDNANRPAIVAGAGNGGERQG